jgi:hypothetical protein
MECRSLSCKLPTGADWSVKSNVACDATKIIIKIQKCVLSAHIFSYFRVR